MKEIVQTGHPALKAKALEVPPGEITSPKIRTLIAEMREALANEPLGVAIAAPQLGASVRIFVVSGNALAKRAEKAPGTVPDTVFINPVFVKLSKKKKLLHEGCLSVRGLWGMVERSEKATIHALTERAMPITVNAEGLLAHIFQHEMDHLDGILYIEKADEIFEEKEPELHE